MTAVSTSSRVGRPSLVLVLLMQVLLMLPATVRGAKFGFFWCPRYNTDAAAATDEGIAQLKSMGTLNLLLEDGSNFEEDDITCAAIRIDFNNNSHSFVFATNEGDDYIGSGPAELIAGETSYIHLKNITNSVLGARNNQVKLYIKSLDESELVLITCRDYFFIHYEFFYVMSTAYKVGDLMASCATSTIKSEFGFNTKIKSNSNC